MKVSISQKIIILNDKGQILTLLRGDTAPSNPNKWDLPGGNVDPGEDYISSIQREIKEETELDIANVKAYDVEGYASGDGFWITIAYQAKTDSQDIKISYEHDEFKWVYKEEFLELDAIKKLKQFVKNL